MDEPAFEAFHRKTARLLWNRIYRLTGNAAKADDISQKAYIQFIRLVLREITDTEFA